jgi:hypothetical protein
MVDNREIGGEGTHATRIPRGFPFVTPVGGENKQRAEPETVLQVLGIKPSILSIYSVGHLSQLITYGYSLPGEASIVCSSARGVVA